MVLSHITRKCSAEGDEWGHADTLVENLTVREMLLYTAEMKLELSVNMAEKRERVDLLLKQLALEACQNVRIGNNLSRGISGSTVSPCTLHFWLLLALCSVSCCS